jgi:hypothetical protein
MSYAPYVDAIGTAINAHVAAKIGKENAAAKTADTLRRLAAQKALLDEEQGRQQGFAQGARDAFDANVGLYNNFEGQIGDQKNVLAQMFMDALASGKAPENVPIATPGAVANREAAMLADASSKAQTDARNLAGVQAFGQAFQNNAIQQDRNSSIADIINNFAQGSRAAIEPAMQAANVSRFVEKQNTNYLGDMLKLGAGLSDRFGNRTPQITSPYAIVQPDTRLPGGQTGFTGTGSTGLKVPGLGIK